MAVARGDGGNAEHLSTKSHFVFLSASTAEHDHPEHVAATKLVELAKS